MFERFTDRARKVMALANQEAQRFNHEYTGTEHILLGLVKEGSGVGANVLKNLEVDLRKVRLETIDQLSLPGHFAAADVDHDLLQPRHLHDVLIPEALHQPRHQLLPILLFQAVHRLRSCRD